jgi:hypothetical protein
VSAQLCFAFARAHQNYVLLRLQDVCASLAGPGFTSVSNRPLRARYGRLVEREHLARRLAAHEGHDEIAERASERGLSVIMRARKRRDGGGRIRTCVGRANRFTADLL